VGSPADGSRPLCGEQPNTSENEQESRQGGGRSSVTLSIAPERDNSNVVSTAPQIRYNRATNCSNTTNSHNVNTNNSIYKDSSHIENHYNGTEDPLKEFGRL